MLPDGSLLYVIHEPNAFHKLGLCVDGVGQELLEEDGDIQFPVYSPSGHIVYGRSFGTGGYGRCRSTQRHTRSPARRS